MYNEGLLDLPTPTAAIALASPWSGSYVPRAPTLGNIEVSNDCNGPLYHRGAGQISTGYGCSVERLPPYAYPSVPMDLYICLSQVPTN